MSIKPFAFASASSVRDVVQALDESCRPLAGGTDLLGLMKDDLAAPERLVSIRAVGMDGITGESTGLSVGATTTLSQLAAAPELSMHPELACLYEALLATASPQLRHMATLGGNLMQRPRCWYYRNALAFCWRKGGQMCYAFRGENKYHVLLGGGPCYAVHPSDPAVALVALDASVRLTGPDSERSLPLSAFYHKPSRDERTGTALALNQLITAVEIPLPPAGSRSAYVKVADRSSWDFALTSVAAVLTVASDTVQRARIALGGVATTPWRATAAEDALVGRPLGAEAIEAAATGAVEGVRPLEHNAYKVDLLQGAVREALRRLMAP